MVDISDSHHYVRKWILNPIVQRMIGKDDLPVLAADILQKGDRRFVVISAERVDYGLAIIKLLCYHGPNHKSAESP